MNKCWDQEIFVETSQQRSYQKNEHKISFELSFDEALGTRKSSTYWRRKNPHDQELRSQHKSRLKDISPTRSWNILFKKIEGNTRIKK